MTDEDKPRFVAAMNWLARKYPLVQYHGNVREEVPRALPVKDLDDWFTALKNIHIERIEWATRYHYGHCRFFPKPVELREAAGAAPLPKALSLANSEANKLLPEKITPPDEAKKRLQGLFDELNGTFGTRLRA